jgi:L-tyrosine peroxygenase
MVSAAITERVDTWDFGGYPYGLAPLVLPAPTVRIDDGDRRGVERQLALMAAVAGDPGIPAESVEQLFWFRWIIGNQVAAALWQILDDELAVVLRLGTEAAARNAAALLDGYSVVLIHAGTPTRQLYHQLIRPAMARQHRSFTGRWAQDYVPVMARLQTLRNVYRRREHPEHIGALIDASKRNHRVHVAIAAKLVPGEDSLLKSNDGLASLGAATEETTLLYDAFYCTARALVPRERIVEQLIVRFRAIIRDIRTNGMYPASCSSKHERPAELWAADITALEENCVDVLDAAAYAAAAALQRDHRE